MIPKLDCTDFGSDPEGGEARYPQTGVPDYLRARRDATYKGV